MRTSRVALVLISAVVAIASAALETARDTQDRAALERAVADASAAAAKNANDPDTNYSLALAQSYLAEVALELKDKPGAAKAAEAGIEAARKAVSLNGKSPEYHRLLGTLCGQIIPASTLLGFKYGHCALGEINKALELDPKFALAYVSRGVGNYYLPEQLGGGPQKSITDFQKALSLNPKLAEAHLWTGLAFRKLHRDAEARDEFEKALALNPKRVWIKQQLDKTPAK